jgi:AcrR family transcriptional regulator
MGVTGQTLGLRDRKKLQTRDAIRRSAMSLIAANGYANTTIEQIAEASDISPSTFFRYFPTKESVLMANDLDQVTLAALAAQPANLTTLQAFREALAITLTTLSADEWRFERTRLRLVLSVPELKSAQFGVYRTTMAELATTEAARIGREPHDPEVRAVMGAIAGGLMAVIDRSSDAPERMLRALDVIEAGMSLA